MTLPQHILNLADECMWRWCDGGCDPTDIVVLVADRNDPGGAWLLQAAISEPEGFDAETKGMTGLYFAVAVPRSIAASSLTTIASNVASGLEDAPKPAHYWLVCLIDGGARLSSQPVPTERPKPDGWNRTRHMWRLSSSKKRKRHKLARTSVRSGEEAARHAAGHAATVHTARTDLSGWHDPIVMDMADLTWLDLRDSGARVEDKVIAVAQASEPIAKTFLHHACRDVALDLHTSEKIVIIVSRAGALEFFDLIGESTLGRRLERQAPGGGFWLLLLFGKSVALTTRPRPSRDRATIERAIDARHCAAIGPA